MTLVLTFAVALAVAMASPGPAIAALLARILARGVRGIPAFCAGLIAGDMLWLAASVFGLALLAQAAQPVFAFVKYAGAAYLLWLAYKLWTAPAEAPAEAPASRADATPAHGARLFAAGLTLALGNPKTMVFYVALAPALVDLAHLSAGEFVLLEAILAMVYATVLAAYVLLAARARRLVKDSRAMRRVNRASGAVMAGAGVLVATR